MFNKRFYVYVLLTYLTGTTIATFVPIMSLYLKDKGRTTKFVLKIEVKSKAFTSSEKPSR